MVFSHRISEKKNEITTDTAAVKAKLLGNNIAGFPAMEFTPAGEWRYGMASAQKNAPETFTVVEAPMTDNPYDGTPPVSIQVPLKVLPQWASSFNAATATENPTSLPSSAELQSAGAAQMMTLVPYGSTYLRLTMLPVVQ